MTPPKVAIVTAAGHGMGEACARELAAQGYRVALLSPSGAAEKLATQLGGMGRTGSVTEEKDLRELVTAAHAAYGRIDAVVNNTGHPPKGDLLELSDEQWRAGMDMVFLNVVRMTRLVTPVMVRQGGGAIVNISTLGAVQPSLKFPVSSTLRAGLSAFTKLFAERYASAGIRMNNVLPGFIDSFPVDESIRATIPMGRYGTVAEIAQTVAFLLSPAAGYITGQNIRIDGGATRGL
jgi:NAD(P)-dependent dehydrogenase (short-subunit alcohol dehydrogenase family)